MRATNLKKSMGVAISCGVLCLLSAAANAQESLETSLNRYEHPVAGDTFMAVPGPWIGGDLEFRAMTTLDIANDPLVLTSADGETELATIVSNQTVLHLDVSLALWDRLLVSVGMPFALHQEGDQPTLDGVTYHSPDSAAVGDLRLGLRFRIWGENRDPFQIGVGGILNMPTGASEEYMGEGAVYGHPRLLIGGNIPHFTYGAALGTRLTGSNNPHSFNFSAGVGLLLLDEQMQIGPEVFGSVGFGDAELSQHLQPSSTTAVEGLLAIQFLGLERLRVGTGVGTAFTSGVGVPDVRVLTRIGYTPAAKPPPGDRDGDGITDDVDACPEVAGSPNTNAELHGCPPDEDRDGDGIVDGVDGCPDVPGAPSEDPEKHGCPPDRDGDGITDEQDACPDVPGAPNAEPARHGCPPDRDGDGILDEVDACPDLAGEPNEDPKKHGCAPDRDGDGIADAVDACPDVAGVPSEDPKKHGCPGDRDGDSFLDAVDACPDQPGRAHEDPKRHGCPLLIVTAKEIKILQKVEFAVGSAKILAASDTLLDDAAKIVNAHRDIKRIEVQGHTDNQGGVGYNRQLSQNRANSVVQALVKRGVDKKRLVAKGYGQSDPIASNATPEGRQKNRRVQFKILERSKP